MEGKGNKIMTKEKEIREAGNIIYSAYLSQNHAHNKAAADLYDAGWRKQVEAEWIPTIVTNPKYGVPVIVGFTCSNCQIKQEVSTNYCSFCGAKMVGRK